MEGDVTGRELATMGTRKPALKTLHAMSHRVRLRPIDRVGLPLDRRSKHERIL